MSKTNSIRHFEKLHRYYEKKAYAKLIKDFRAIIDKIDFNNIFVDKEDISKTLLRIYVDTGIDYGKLVNKDIAGEKKSVPFQLFNQRFIKYVTDYFKKEGLSLVKTITDTLISDIAKVVASANEIGKTQREITDIIKKTVNSKDFYRWQALRIARTESLFAMNAAKVTSFETSTIKMSKVWVQGGSRHRRAEHTMMNGTSVSSDQYFTLPNGEKCLYPGDKSLSASQVINCSCTIAYKPMRDNNGNLIFK